MEETYKNQLLKLIGKTFKGTLICDEILKPFFIVRYAEGGFGVMKTRTDAKGNLKFRAVCYPATFVKCLHTIAVEKQHPESQVFESIQEYIENWKNVSDTILNAYKEWNVENI